MVGDAVVLHDDVGASPGECSDEKIDFLWSPLMNQRGESPCARKEHWDFGEVICLLVGVSNVAQVQVLLAWVHSQNTKEPAPETDEIGLPVDEQHDAPHDGLGIERVRGDTGPRRIPVVDLAVGGKLYFGPML